MDSTVKEHHRVCVGNNSRWKWQLGLSLSLSKASSLSLSTHICPKGSQIAFGVQPLEMRPQQGCIVIGRDGAPNKLRIFRNSCLIFYPDIWTWKISRSSPGHIRPLSLSTGQLNFRDNEEKTLNISAFWATHTYIKLTLVSFFRFIFFAPSPIGHTFTKWS